MSECNSVESADITYYQRNQDAILNRANTETYLKEKKNKIENMGGTDITICLKKKTKIKRISKNLSRG